MTTREKGEGSRIVAGETRGDRQKAKREMTKETTAKVCNRWGSNDTELFISLTVVILSVHLFSKPFSLSFKPSFIPSFASPFIKAP